MINEKELFYKINAVIDFLEKHDGHKHKIYNRCCPDSQSEPDSDIVEYAEDIEYMISNYLNPNDFEDYLINEICKLIRDNIKAFMFDDTKLIKFKEYNRNYNSDKNTPTPYELLCDLTKEVAIELLSTMELYDFRDLD